MGTTNEQLREYIASQILKQPNRPIPDDEALISSGLIDSFSLVDLAMFVEDQFGVRIDDSELNAATFDSLAQLAGLIEQRQA
ncbi:MAG: acyl carrier protein [Anaerolineales bacterium]|nr:acyl carrier protein [Anaerolineales bacterium]